MSYNEAIYKYIKYIFEKSGSSKRKFSTDHLIDESTLRNILGKKKYQISLHTIYNICEAKRMDPSEFFSEVEKMFPEIKVKKVKL